MKIAALALIAATQSAAPTAGTVTVGEVAPTDGSRPAMRLADRLLPAEVRTRVVEGRVRQMWLPGQAYWIGYREAAHPAAPDLCERKAYALEAKSTTAPTNDAPPETVLTLGLLDSWTEVAVLASGVRATESNCARAAGFIRRRGAEDRSVAAYRVLVAAMAVARGKRDLPFRLTCQAEDPSECADPRAALSKLPMGVLYGISTSCLDTNRYRDGSVVRCRPLAPGEPYKADAQFGMSPPNGRSWGVSFVHRPGWP